MRAHLSWLIASTLALSTATVGAPGVDSKSPSDTLSVRVPGARLHYVEQGSGTPIVLVHGSLGELGDWREEIAAFATTRRVIAYSRRFHPPNAPAVRKQEYRLDQHAEDLAALIRATHAAPAHLFGHSYGAYVALRMAILHPELVRSLVLVEPPVLGWLRATPVGDSVWRDFESKALRPARVAFARGDSVVGMQRFLEGVTRPGAWDAMPAEAHAGILRNSNEMRSEMLTPFTRYMTPITCAQVRRVKRPMLIVRGERSARLFHLITDQLEACVPTADTLTVPGASHGAAAHGELLHQRALAFFAAH